MKKSVLMTLVTVSILGFGLTEALAGGAVTHRDEAVTKVHPKGASVKFLATPQHHGAKDGFMSILKLPAGGKVPEHRDPTEEYLYFLKGAGTIWIDDVAHACKPGSAVFMPANAKVRFESDASAGEVEVVQFFAPAGPEKKYDSWK